MLTQPAVKKDLTSVLKILGLKDQEIDLYTHALALGPVGARVLAQHLGISTPNVYKLVDRLEALGLVHLPKIKRYGRAIVVEPPSVLQEKVALMQKEQADVLQTFQKTLPELLAHYQQGELPTKVRVLQGRDQFQAAIEQMFAEVKDEVRVFGSIEDFIACVSPDVFRLLTIERLRRGIGLKALVLPGKEASKLAEQAAKEHRDVRFLRDAPSFITTMQLSPRKAIIWQPKAPLAVLIEDEFIVQMLTAMFEMLWGQAGTSVRRG